MYHPTDLVTIDGQPSSLELVAQLADENAPVMLGFSRGKDSLASWLFLRDHGIEVKPYFLYHVPGLRFVEESLAAFEEFFDTEIHRYPHPAMLRWLAHFTFQSPEHLAVIEAAGMPEPTYEEVAELIRAHLGIPGAWNCDGVRAADSPNRRMAMTTAGPRRDEVRKISIVWDWRVRHVREALAHHGCPLPIDYELFGRSFDGLDRRFLEPLKQHCPDDYELILSWFPMAEVEMIRDHLAAA
ncbi:hypothetical protein NLX83_13815 [Allokutzneria sp. A3M-2-11 16]|uniref:hypothetical protein n=1 Tax=Allokutzneria sp. A3M-2-11 16 TaxID=2962043 RepID=UPI0020B7E7A3|nr:hypothetical protein [Allokutzneria sp. A3M-2-11 16]MCP3800336.1 hypothetical protein [Allokutzneria sp. A3M-2-11 16]